MRLDVRAMAWTCGLLWAGAVFFVAIANLLFHGYGVSFLDMVASIYPGYHGPGGFGSAIVAGVYALVDGWVGGLVLAWLYNGLAKSI